MATRPFETITLSLVNIKGGVAKSVSSLFIAWGLALSGYQVLLLDMDPQSNSTYSLTGELSELPDGTLYEVLKEHPTKTLREVIKATRHPNLYVASGSLWLSSTEIELISATMREFVLKNALAEVLPYFHFVIIDTPPNLGLLTINAMVASTYLIVPTTLKLFGLVGIRILNRTLDVLRAKFGQFSITLPILGVLVTQVRRPMTKNAKERYAQLQRMYGEKLFTTIIPLTEKLEEATDQESGQEMTGYAYSPGGIGTQAYAAVVKEILHRVGVHPTPKT